MLKRFSSLFSDVLGLFADEVKKQGPETLLETEKQRLREQIARFHQALASHASLCERLMTQIKGLEKDEEDLRGSTTAYLRAGKREAAGASALQLQTVQRELEENRRQLEEAETSYRELLTARDAVVKSAQAKIETLRLSLSDLEVKQTMAELPESASTIISPVGAVGDTLDRLTRMVNEERYRAAGRARFAREFLAGSDAAFKAFEQKALADEALENFAAREGLTLEDGKADPKANRPTTPGTESTDQPPQ